MSNSLRQCFESLHVHTSGEGFLMVTRPVADWLTHEEAGDGLLTLLIKHTSASLTLQENYDPDVRDDLVDAYRTIAPFDRPYRHSIEGRDDMPAHIKATLVGSSLSIPVRNGAMDIGIWQGLYVVEHRAMAHERIISLHYIGT